MIKIGKNQKVGFTFTKEQLVRLFDTINNPKVMVACFAARICGLRLEEVCSLKWENIDLENRRLTVLNSKWKFRKKDGYGKDRFVRIPKIAVEPLEKWKGIIGVGIWFLPSDKSPDLHMRKKTLYEQFHQYLRLAGLADVHFLFNRIGKNGKSKEIQTVNRYKLNFHSFRAYYVVDCRKRGIPIEIIAEQLGHVDINTTVGYARYLDKEKDEILDRAFDKPLLQDLGIDKEDETKKSSFTQRPLVSNLKPLEYLQMQFLQSQISEKEYFDRLSVINGNGK